LTEVGDYDFVAMAISQVSQDLKPIQMRTKSF